MGSSECQRLGSTEAGYQGAIECCGLFSLWTRGSWVLDTSVGSKLLVALGLVLLLHFIE
jgi:hypothetical protein